MKKPFYLLFSIVLFSIVYAKSDWTASGKHIAYPAELYFVGIGMSERGLNEAKQAAVIEVQKQLSSRINATTTDMLKSLETEGREIYANSISSISSIKTSGKTRGVQVVETKQKGKIFYALAVLDKDKFASANKSTIKELKKEVRKLKKEAEADISSGKFGQALRKISLAKRKIREIKAQRILLTAAKQLTKAEELEITESDLVSLIEKCLSSLQTEKVGGDKQSLMVGMVPAEPFIVKVSAQDMPITGVKVRLKNDDGKTVMEKYTNNEGLAEFPLGGKAETSVGKHEYITTLRMRVSSKQRKLLTSLDQTFSYKVESNPCYANIMVEAPADMKSRKKKIAEKVISRFAKYDIKHDQESDKNLKVEIGYKETGHIRGVSASRTFVKTDINAIISVLDDSKELFSFTAKGKGTGSTKEKSVIKGISVLKLRKNIEDLTKHVCVASQTAPKKKIAVFPFKANGHIYGWTNIAESITDMITTKLINTRKLDVVERAQMEKIMKEKQLGMAGLLSMDEELQVAQLAGAEMLLIGSASVSGGKIEIDARIVSIASGVALTAMHSTGHGTSQLRALADDVVGKIKMSKLK